MATITALRRAGTRIAIELDDRAWRTVPLEAVVAARLSVGVELDRPHARALARALRQLRAEDVALRALARREHSRATLETRLERAGVRGPDREAVLARAERAGLVDDERYATARARALAERGAGDELVLDDLVRHGVAEPLARSVLTRLEPEGERLARIVASRGLTPSTVRFLAGKGFSAELLADLVAEIESRALR